MTYQFDTVSIECSEIMGGKLIFPTDWETELQSEGFLEAASKLLLDMDPSAVEVPWIIGSASKNLYGMERSDSKSHADHLAFDMSPMYSSDQILSPDRLCMGLAWNPLKLAAIAPATRSGVPFVVEGDHLHVVPSGHRRFLKDYEVITFWSIPSYYPVQEVIGSSPLLASLIDSTWIFKLTEAKFVKISDSDARNAIEAALGMEGLDTTDLESGINPNEHESSHTSSSSGNEPIRMEGTSSDVEEGVS